MEKEADHGACQEPIHLALLDMGKKPVSTTLVTILGLARKMLFSRRGQRDQPKAQ